MAYNIKDEAIKYTKLGIPIIPFRLTPQSDGEKKTDPVISSKELNEWRLKIATNEKINEWFDRPDVNAFAVAINNTRFGIDGDGEGKDLFVNEFLGNGNGHSKLSKSLVEKFNTTTLTKTMHNGYHWTFNINTDELPGGVASKGQHNIVFAKHNEIKIIGEGMQLFERGPGYESVRGPECAVTLNRKQIGELLGALESSKKEIDKARLEVDTITDIAKMLTLYYRPGYRDAIIFSLTGPLHKGRTPNQTVKNIAQQLADLTNYPDENIDKTFATIDQKYARNPDSDEVNGWSLFIQALEDARPESITDTNHAAKVIDQIERKLNRIGFYEMSYSKTFSNGNNSKYQFSPEINQQLEGHIYKIIKPGPPIGMILADINQQKIFRVTIPVIKNKSSEQNTATGTSTAKTQLQISKTLHYVELIIDAIPDKIKIYYNPIDTSAPRRYQITWNTRSSLPSKKGMFFITGPGSIESTLQELENKNMIIKKLSARDALASIISAIETEGDEQKIEIDETVETSGYYLINGKFITRNITQQDLDREPDKDSVLECVEFLDALSTKWKDTNKFPTVIKWAVLAPFNYILKTSTKDSNSYKWLPLIHMHNWSSSGKTSLGKIVLAIWRKHGTLDKKDHQIGFSNIDTEARFGTVISKTTYPILVNEVGALSAQGDRYQWLVELIKIAVESPNTRGKYVEKRYTSIPALSALIFTSNPKPPKDSGYRTRATIMHFSKNEVHPRGSEEAVEFEKWLSSKLHLLGVLGDFVAREFIIS